MLEPGTEAPDFQLTDQEGKSVRLHELRGKRTVVLFFYPKDNTLVCTLEMCAFRDDTADLEALDAEVFGISTDTVVSHRRVAAQWGLSYRLLSDPGGRVRKAYKVERTLGLFPGRVTYVIDKAGIIRGAFNDPLQARKHVRKALEALRAQGMR